MKSSHSARAVSLGVILFALLTAGALGGCPSPRPDGGAGGGGGGGGGDGDADGDAQALRFFLATPEPDNTAAPTIEVDAQGGIHAVYPAYAGGGAYYAYCPADCGGPEDVSVVRLDSDGTVANAMLALDPDGHPHVLLAAYAYVYYATCDGDCTDPASWSESEILKHDGDREVTGEAFALDREGHPRFLMHTYVAYLGIGQKAPETHYVTCDADCLDPASWSSHRIATQIWRSSQLRFDAQGHPRVATVAIVDGGEDAPDWDLAAYAECLGDCTLETSWQAVGLEAAFTSDVDAVSIHPAVSLALTRAGAPRILVLGKDDAGTRRLVYFACDQGCTGDAWAGTVLSDGDALGAGLDLTLDAADHPRFVYTFNYAIGLASCDEEDCESPEAPWDLVKVEAGADMSPDEIFLWPNCYVGAWFLHSPSIALTPDGAPRVGYQARDISGGWSNPDPDEPDCVAGTDMTWSRIALLSSRD